MSPEQIRAQGGEFVVARVPFIAQMVHYQSYGTPAGEYLSEPRAAIVTEVEEDGAVGLAVLNPSGLFFQRRIPHAEEPTPGHWNFIPDAEVAL